MINMLGNPKENLPELSRVSFIVILVVVCLIPSIPQSHSISTAKNWSSRVVTTKLGLTRGFLFMPKGFGGVEIFLGIPYASAPIASLRLMPPVSGSPWSGTLMNEEPGPVCPQVFPLNERRNYGGESGGSGSGSNVDESESAAINETEILKKMPRGRLIQLKKLAPFLKNMSEDCLYLNIYVPLSVTEGKMDRVPVLIFIHGGNSWGSGFPFDPSMMVSIGNVIAITFNFRLGILGFLNANSDGYFKSPANFAILDQIAALHWVQENIANFGGDAGNVTLMGHKEGAMYVNFLQISNALPSSEPLFHRVILMSGSALSPFTVGLSYGKDLAKKFAGRFKCPTEPPSNLLQCARQLPLQYFLDSELWNYFGPSDDGVVIENGIRENILRDKLSRYPMIFGVTKAEFLPTLSENEAVYGLETEKRREILKKFIDGFYSSASRNEILAASIHEYTDWERSVQHPISVRDETLEALTDAQVVAPLLKVGELSSQVNSRTYFYVFEYQSKTSDYIQRLGSVPLEDLQYIVAAPIYLASANAEHQVDSDWEEGTRSSSSGGGGPTSVLSQDNQGLKLGFFTGNFTRNEVQLSYTLVHYWANFIRTGNPNFEPSDTHQEGGLSQGGINFPSGDLASQNRFPSHQDKSLSSMSSQKPKLIEWPSYDALQKKYLSIEAKPRIRNHYRAHKISFWNILVESMGHIYNNGVFPNRPEGRGYPNIINSNNSSAPHLPSIQLVDRPYWEQHPFYFSGNYSTYYPPGGDISLGSRPNHRPDYSTEGYHIYSTALSVTITVGCALLILNILVFAAFYYFRDKRRTSRQSSANQQNLESHLHHQHPPGPILASGGSDIDTDAFSPMDLQGAMVDSNRQLSCSSAETMIHPSIHNTPIRLKENGQVMNLFQQHQHHSQPPQMLPMPNVCGDLPMTNLQQLIPDSGRNPQQQYYPPRAQSNTNIPLGGGVQSSTLPSNKQRTQQRNSLQNFELSMPDAILAAAMMLNYRQNNSSQVQGGSDFFFGTGHKSSSVGKRPSLNMKEQLLLSAGISAASTAPNAGSNNVSVPPSNRPGVVVGNLPAGRSSVPGNGYNTPVSTNITSAVGSGGINSNVCSNVIQFDFDNGSKTVPRPPKRHTPTVKFSPDTFSSADGSICSGSLNANVNISAGISSPIGTALLESQPQQQQPGIINSTTNSSVQVQPLQQTTQSQPAAQLKSSLKKHSNYPGSGLSEELNV